MRVQKQMVWVSFSQESAVTLTSSLHHTEHLCKHRATAAMHRCWQTVSISPQTMCCFQISAKLSFCTLLPQKDHVEQQLGKKDNQFFHLFSKQKDGRKEFLQLEKLVFVLNTHALLSAYQPTVLSLNTLLPSPDTWRQLSQASWCLRTLGSAFSQSQAGTGGDYSFSQNGNNRKCAICF